MARPRKLYTLTELSSKTGISLPTLQRYKKQHQGRIPAEGTGRKQRYPREAIPVIERIRKENLAKRGRPRKDASKTAAKPAARKARGKKRARRTTAKRPRRAAKKAVRRSAKPTARMAASRKGGATRGLLTLTEISKRTGISYPTLSRYVKLFLDKIPHVGEGRKRRFPRRAVSAFQKLRASSRRGRRPKAAAAKTGPGARRGAAVDATLARRIKELEKAQAAISKQLDSVIRQLKKPLTLTIRSE